MRVPGFDFAARPDTTNANPCYPGISRLRLADAEYGLSGPRGTSPISDRARTHTHTITANRPLHGTLWNAVSAS
jgi:hypothetical protein